MKIFLQFKWLLEKGVRNNDVMNITFLQFTIILWSFKLVLFNIIKSRNVTASLFAESLIICDICQL